MAPWPERLKLLRTSCPPAATSSPSGTPSESRSPLARRAAADALIAFERTNP
jgi:hypothetical protein